MNVLNLNQETLQQLLPRIQKNYPDAIIKRPFIGLETILVPFEDILFTIAKRRTDFVIDFDFCKSHSKVISVAFGTLGMFITKFVFTVRNKRKIEQFGNSFIDIVNSVEE
jgi:hypothetical protein